MPRKPETENPEMSRDNQSPSITPKRIRQPAKPRAANVNKNLPIKKPAATAEKIAVYTTEKPDKSKTANQHGDCGSAQITSPVKLTLKERKALELAAFQGLYARQVKFVDLWSVTYNAPRPTGMPGINARPKL